MTAPAQKLVPIGEIVQGLAQRAEALCREILPAGRRRGHEWEVPSAVSPWGCDASVHLTGARAGVWGAWSAAEYGDALDLVAAVLFHGDKSNAVKWALGWLGYERGEPPPAPRATPANGAGSGKAAAADEDEAQRRRSATAMFLAAKVDCRGTPVEHYLQGRGIDIGAIPAPYGGRWPGALRFHLELWNERTRRYWPAMLAVITRGPQIVAVHRTWLTPDGQKAPIVDEDGKSQAKLTYGSYAGGLVSLWRGASGKKLKEALPGEAIMLSEGIEDGLSAVIGRPDLRCAAAVSLSNMGSVELPPAIRTVIILKQNDPWWSEKAARGEGGVHAAQRGIDRAIRHFQSQGRDVLLATPPAGKDINDLLRGKCA